MNLESIETIIRWLGGLLAYSVLAILMYGIWRGTQRQAGRTSGCSSSLLRSSWFYFSGSLLFFGLSAWGWKPLPLSFSPPVQIGMLIFGSILYFPGLSLLLWGRLALGKYYFVSTGMGAQLFQNHQLVTTGPYAFLRHPMYLGLIMAAFGSLLLYHTWTTLFFSVFAPFILLRARREEIALSAEFGEQWQQYTHQVPAFVPRLRRKK